MNLRNRKVSGSTKLSLLLHTFFGDYVRFGNVKCKCIVIKKISPVNTD